MITIYLSDAKIKYSDAQVHFKAAEQWASDHCQSFLGAEINDVSDFSVEFDTVGEYRFENEQDAIMFRLRYS